MRRLEDYWCPNGSEADDPCFDEPILGSCGCYEHKENVKKLSNPTGGTNRTWTYWCSHTQDCDAEVIFGIPPKLKCIKRDNKCEEGTVYADPQDPNQNYSRQFIKCGP